MALPRSSRPHSALTRKPARWVPLASAAIAAIIASAAPGRIGFGRSRAFVSRHPAVLGCIGVSPCVALPQRTVHGAKRIVARSGVPSEFAPLAALTNVMDSAGLAGRADDAAMWCDHEGAASLEEVFEHYESLASDLDLDATQRARLEDAMLDRMYRDGSPVGALLLSPTLRRAARLLVTLRRSAGGHEQFMTLVGRAEEQLLTGRADWESLFGMSDMWQAAGINPAEAEATFRVAALLMTLGNNQATEVTLHAQHGEDSFDCVVSMPAGNASQPESRSAERIRLRRSEASAGWGPWASFEIAEGPSHMIGSRLVALQRAGAGNEAGEGGTPAQGHLVAKPGDRLYFASADRAAILEVATFDQLPEMAESLAELLLDPGAALQARAQGMRAAPDMLEAATFWNSLKDLPADAPQMGLRLARLQQSPLVRDLLQRAQSDPLWGELLTALKPRAQYLYTAVRTAWMRSRKPAPIKPRRVTVLQVNWPRVAALAFVIVATLYGFYMLWQAVQPPDGSDLPLYTLSGSQQPATRPLLAGTPFRPFGS